MSIVESVCRELDAHRNLALVSIVQQLASAPRHAGASMLVNENGLVDGTVGGSSLEGAAIEKAKEVAKSGVAQFMDVRLSGEDAAGNGMICGGSLRLFIEPVRPDENTRVLFTRLAIAMASGDDMFSVVPCVAPGHRRLCRIATRKWPLPIETTRLVREALDKHGLCQPLEFTDSEGQRFVLEPWQAPWRVIFLGGGHVAQATAKLAAMTDFTVCVVDDREEFASKERFPEASLVRAIPGFTDCFAGLSPSSKTFLVIVTRGHLYDRVVLDQALDTDAGYIGMIGSRKKIASIYRQLREEGRTEADLARVTAPVGLEIGAETPEEIAVSIVAQLVAARARQHGGRRHLQACLAGNPAERTAPREAARDAAGSDTTSPEDASAGSGAQG